MSEENKVTDVVQGLQQVSDKLDALIALSRKDRDRQGEHIVVEQQQAPVVEKVGAALPAPVDVPSAADIPGTDTPWQTETVRSGTPNLDPDKMDGKAIKTALKTTYCLKFNNMVRTEKARAMLWLCIRGVTFDPSESVGALTKKVMDSDITRAVTQTLPPTPQQEQVAGISPAPMAATTPSRQTILNPSEQAGILDQTAQAPAVLPTAQPPVATQAPVSPAVEAAITLSLLQEQAVKLGNTPVVGGNWEQVYDLVRRYGATPSGNVADLSQEHYVNVSRAFGAALRGEAV